MTAANQSIALIDCNNFYVSCERVFNPALKKKTGHCSLQQRWVRHCKVTGSKGLGNQDGCAVVQSSKLG